MNYLPTKVFFDPKARGQMLRGDSKLRRRYPALGRFTDRLGVALVRKYESLLSDRHCIERQYQAFVGEPLDLENPRLLSEKVQWLKLNAVTPLHTICADKIRARDFVRETIGERYLIPALLISDDVRDLTPDNIRAERFAAKSNHDWGGVILCQDRASFDWSAARAELSSRLKRPFWRNFRELAYRDIPPGIIVETFLESRSGGLPSDYKFFCFHGKPALIQVVNGRDGWPTWTMYDLDWNLLPVWRRGRPRSETLHEQPGSLAEMIELAAQLSEPFRFCRVDFYDVDGQIYFGEMAFYPEAGYRPFEPREFERELGDLLHLEA